MLFLKLLILHLPPLKWCIPHSSMLTCHSHSKSSILMTFHYLVGVFSSVHM
jgi:hypothetical protein